MYVYMYVRMYVRDACMYDVFNIIQFELDNKFVKINKANM